MPLSPFIHLHQGIKMPSHHNPTHPPSYLLLLHSTEHNWQQLPSMDWHYSLFPSISVPVSILGFICIISFYYFLLCLSLSPTPLKKTSHRNNEMEWGSDTDFVSGYCSEAGMVDGGVWCDWLVFQGRGKNDGDIGIFETWIFLKIWWVYLEFLGCK